MIVLLFLVLGCSNVCRAFVNNHSFVFITGWPQSGTSLVQQFMTSCPVLSTMTEKCEELLGKRCINWNHEGQWLLRGTTRQFFNSGAMCPSNTSGLTHLQKTTVMDEWKQFWSLDKPYLAEKSPQSLLKTALLRQLTGGSQKIRIIIVLKNPVTLNIATPKNAGWKYYRESSLTPPSSSSSSSGGAVSAKKIVTSAQSALTLDHFVDFMTHDRSNSSGVDCSLGWLPAMDTLHRQLVQDVNSTRDIRIVRYEQFERPNPLCRAIFAFVMDSNNSSEFTQTATKVCDVFFPLAVPRTSVAIHTDTKSARNSNMRTTSNGNRNKNVINPNRGGPRNRRLAFTTLTEESVSRALRLRNYQDSKVFNFIPELVTTVGQERVQEFLFASQRTLRGPQRVVDSIEQRLLPYGYSLKEWRRKKGGAGTKSNLFSQWEFDV